jgi:uracil-DNA glycosylase family 4
VGAFEDLNNKIIASRNCPRLVAWREQVAREKRRSFAHEEYWGRPIPNFGDPEALGLIVGLAPAAHGANRTGRMFTGDRSGEWLYRALFRAGLANQAEAVSNDDGLRLAGVMITAVVHCAPPDNKPTGEEVANCRPYLLETLGLRPWRAYLCLGGLAWGELFRVLGEKRAPFAHGARVELSTGAIALASYHPSQQNTFTGRLTEAMLDDVVGEFGLLVRAP